MMQFLLGLVRQLFPSLVACQCNTCGQIIEVERAEAHSKWCEAVHQAPDVTN